MEDMESMREIDGFVKRGEWLELAELLDFPLLDNPRKIERDAWPVWGLPDELDRIPTLLALDAELGLRVIACEATSPKIARRIMRSVASRNPAELTVWLWHSDTELTVAMHVDGRTRRLVVGRDGSDRAGLSQLEALRLREVTAASENARSVRDHFDEVLDRKRLTRAFFADFKRALQLLEARMANGPGDPQKSHDIALITLLRLVFLYFLQRRGALAGDRRFIARHFRRPHRTTFYRDVLRPLFFEALNTPTAERTPRANALGEIPFLNGGLFDMTPAEAEFQQLDWPNEVWAEVIDELFESYQFLAVEADGDEVRAIDPEMLGKVFEGLMYADERHKSGSFYTPRDVVERMVRDALVTHLDAVDASTITAILEDREAKLSVDERGDLRRALEDLRVLDPAVGTGAFLIEMLHALTRLWEAVEGGKLDHVRTRQLIHDHLFGVDLLSTATRLCELRFWIALLARTPDDAIEAMPPLPNLSHRIAQGNSLLSATELGSYRDDFGGNWLLTNHERVLATKIAELQHKFCTSHGAQKIELRGQLTRIEQDFAVARIRSRIERIDARIAPYQKLANSRDIFGDPNELNSSQRAYQQALIDERDQLVEALKQAVSDRGAHVGFGFDTRFAGAMSAGGFDLIITNPPWVRSERIDRTSLHALKGRYRSFRSELWGEAVRRGVRAPYGAQVDLANLFVERSLELLKPNGRFVGLIPAKLFGSLQGTATRSVVAEHTIEALEDFSDASRELFDATTYPAILQVRKSRPAADVLTNIAVWRGDERSTFEASASSFSSEPWTLSEPHVAKIFERMKTASGGEYLEPSRGIFTGCNALFIREKSEWLDLFGENVRPYLRRVATGRDPSANSARRLLWLYENGQPLDEIPADLAAYFEDQRRRLENRSDHRFDRPLWQVFRVNERHRARVVWRDIAPELEATVLDGEAIALNTVYELGCDTLDGAARLAAFLESEPVRAWLYAHAEPARGGWRRHFAWTMRLLPLPPNFWSWLEELDPTARVDLQVARAYRLDRSALQILRGWRAGSRALAGVKEAA